MKPKSQQIVSLSQSEIAVLEKSIGYIFQNKDLIRVALTHKSASDGKAGFVNNERLEWLGDRVLGLLSARHLFDEHNSFDEGSLTRHFNNIVNGENCAAAARESGLDKLVITSKSISIGSLANESVISDAFEALLGAVYLDGGLEACGKMIEIAIAAARNSKPKKNVKSQLQEWAQKRGFAAPVYKVIERTGPDHEPKFHVEVCAHKHCFKAWGNSKQTAEQAAAQIFIDEVIENDK